jgi:hypothetical protein
LSVFLSPPGGPACGHDLAVECDSVADFLSALKGLSGTVETGAVLAWRQLRQQFPFATFIAVHRQVNEVAASLSRAGVPFEPGDLNYRARLLAEFGIQRGVLNYDFGHLQSAGACEQIFRFCHGKTPDPEWTRRLMAENIQIDLKARVERLGERATGLAKLKAEIAA